MEKLNRPLADELLKMAERDQAMRLKVMNGEAEWDNSVYETNRITRSYRIAQ